MNTGEPVPTSSLERFREYLRFLAQSHVDPRLYGKLDLSGVVQQTMLEAHQAMPDQLARQPEQHLSWLRRILANNLADEIRRMRRDRRDVSREVSLDAALDQSSCRLGQWLVDDGPAPADRLEAEDRAVQVADALNRLPEAQREALVLQHWHGWSLADIARHMGRTRMAVAGLLKRGLKQMREEMQKPTESVG